MIVLARENAIVVALTTEAHVIGAGNRVTLLVSVHSMMAPALDLVAMTIVVVEAEVAIVAAVAAALGAADAVVRTTKTRNSQWMLEWPNTL